MFRKFRPGIRTAIFFIAAALSAQAGEVDALAITNAIQARHLPFGTILDPVFAAESSDQITGYTRCGDSAIWTGHYLAAESFRYKVTKSADALANMRRAIAGIKGLVDVTGMNLLARCMVPISSPFAAGIRSEEGSDRTYTNTTDGWIWVGYTSRDQYSGVIFGLVVAFDMVDDTAIRESISQLVTRLIDFLRGNNWTVVMPDGQISTVFLQRPDQMLAFLQVARQVNPNRYSTLYDTMRILLSGGVAAPIVVDTASDASYFKFNLDYINLYNLLRLESSSFRSIYESAYDVLRRHTVGHQNAFFNMIDRGVYGANAARDTETLELLEGWLLRPRRDKIVDLRNAVAVCGDQACAPIPIAMRPPTDFIWQRNPFQLAGGLYGTVETSGIDYILPYWMARYYGLQPAILVQSSAAANTAVAPESIASIYGTNLGTLTLDAQAQPLPAVLGGVTVKVKDASGLSRDAPLIYVSPAQINFVIPAGTAPGVATFSVQNVTAPARITNTAPTLFSRNGTGSRVAAATAIRTSSASPVPVFQCNGSSCVAVPIELAADSQVFLSLYGTGIRNRTSLNNVRVTINGVAVAVQYAGAQGSFAGLDQVNLPLPLTLRGSGEVSVAVTVDGQTSNHVTIHIR